MKAFARFLCVLSLTAFCVACGGGGGTAPPPPPPPANDLVWDQGNWDAVNWN